MDTRKRGRVELPPSDYRPSRAELSEDLRIDTDPESLAKAVMRDVKIVRRPGDRSGGGKTSRR